MRRSKVIFIKNALVLTFTGLIIRFIGMLFRIWLAGEIGSEGIGLYSQVFSFYMLASAFASTGINTAVTRLVSEELSLGRGVGARKVLIRSAAVTLVIALSSCGVILLSSELIATHIVGDPRAAEALRTLTLSLPFMGLSSCLKGYFIARKKTTPASTSQIFEQLVRIGLISFIVTRTADKGIGAACRGVIFGDAMAEVCSFFFIFISFLIDNKLHLVCKGGSAPPYSVLSRIRHIALPITAGRYLNSLLRTAENVLVPRQLEKNGLSGSEALSVFGVIKGMALPLIFFPASFLNALSTLLIPEMSEALAAGKTYKVRYTAEKCIHITLIAALPLAAIFFFVGEELGDLVYGDPVAGRAIRLLAPIIPFMYLDSVCDGLLKGLDQQFSVFRNSMLDSICRLILIFFLLPRLGFNGFIGIMYLSNVFTCLMNLGRLRKISEARLKLGKWLILPAVISLLTSTTVSLLLRPFGLPSLYHTVIFSAAAASVYLLFVLLLGCIRPEDLK